MIIVTVCSIQKIGLELLKNLQENDEAEENWMFIVKDRVSDQSEESQPDLQYC